MKLTDEQKAELKTEMVSTGTPVRFLRNGQAVNICTGDLSPKGINVMHQPVYWCFPKATAKKIARWLRCKAVFSE